jgi:hypothetical protein
VTASSVVSSDRLCANEREISYSAVNWRVDWRSELSTPARSPELLRLLVETRAWTATASQRQAREQGQVDLGQRARPRVGDKQAGRLARGMERHRDGGALLSAQQRVADAHERGVGRRGVDLQRRPRAQRPKHQLEQAVGDLLVTEDEPAAGGGEQAPAVEQVDAELVICSSSAVRLTAVSACASEDRIASPTPPAASASGRARAHPVTCSPAPQRARHALGTPARPAARPARARCRA